MPRLQAAYRPPKERSQWLLVGLMVGFGLVVAQLFHVQIIDHDYYLNQVGPRIAPGRFSQSIPTPGRILARNGEVLADSVILYHVIANPVQIRRSMGLETAAQRLAPVIGEPASEVLAQLQARQDSRFVEMQRWVSRQRAAKVDGLNIAGITTREAWQRRYPAGRAAAHALGGRNRNHVALSGLEERYRLVLDGRAGAAPPMTMTMGDAGLPPVPGRDVVLTIDNDLQRQVETELDKLVERESPRWASCIIMDPRTGAILAISSRPNYDPADYVKGVPAPGYKWSAVPLAATRYWPVEEVMEQGSTFKILLVAAALSSGKVSPNRCFSCGGHIPLGGPPISCWGKYATIGHGTLDMPGMLAQSCNICASQIALALGADVYRGFLARCGIGSVLQAGFPGEKAGLLPPLDSIIPRDLASMSFGQNVSCSSLQLTAIVSGLVNDGVMMKPHIVAAVQDRDQTTIHEVPRTVERTLCTPEVSRQVRTMLEGAVTRGTGRAAEIPGVRVGGKTGTAEQYDAVLKRMKKGSHMVSFMMVLPADRPRYVIHVACSEPKHGSHGSDVAAPVCQRLGKYLLEHEYQPPASGATGS